jgi:CRISPR-associated protein Cas1
MHVEGQFAANRETTEGQVVHRRVDEKTDALMVPEDESLKQLAGEVQLGLFETEETHTAEGPVTNSNASSELQKESKSPVEKIHARSVLLASDRYNVTAKLDLIETQGPVATPVDYKRGRPKRSADGKLSAWLPERVQICLQALVLRENGFECTEGVLYFHGSRQRVVVPIDDDLISKTKQILVRARKVSLLTQPPPPLVASRKCPKCSLAPICLPDETNRLRKQREVCTGSLEEVRLPATPRDDLRPLYLNTQGLYVGKAAEVLEVKERGKLIQQVRLRDLNQVNLFGNIQVTTQAVQTLLEQEIPLLFFSQGGYFQGMLQGCGLKNILLRRQQFRRADDSQWCLSLAKSLVIGKLRNQRVLLMRNHVEPPVRVLRELKRLVIRAGRASSAVALLGIEGLGARYYFSAFSGMLKPGDQPVNPAAALSSSPRYSFDFRSRNRRPPRDPVNALLSLAYTLLMKDFTVAAAAVGLDPYLGFFHLPRPGKPALALDLMETFRPLVSDSVVISAINNRMVTPECFIPAGNGVSLTAAGRKALFRAYEQRMDQLVTHPWFSYRVSYRRLLEIQTRLLGKVISGELSEYPSFITR